MRRFLSSLLFMTVFSWPERLLALDCAALTGTDIPFALTSEVTTRQSGEKPTTRTQQTQVFRKGRELITYTVDSPTIYLKTRGLNPFFPTDSFYSTQPGDLWKWTYSVDPAAVYLSAGKTVRYSADMKSAGGKLQLAATMTLEFLETGTRELGGCSFHVVKVRRTLEGLSDRNSVFSSSDAWIAPALGVALTSILRTGNIEIVHTPVAISVDFKRIE